jgi:hypothetical protein
MSRATPNQAWHIFPSCHIALFSKRQDPETGARTISITSTVTSASGNAPGRSRCESLERDRGTRPYCSSGDGLADQREEFLLP